MSLVAAVLIGGGTLAYLHSVPTRTSDGPIKIGVIASQSGFAAVFGEVARNSMQMAADEINRRGGIDGRIVELYFEDDHTDPKEAVSAFQKLVSVDGVDMVVGGQFDFTTIPLLPIADSSHTAFISPGNFYIPGGLETTEHTFVMMPSFSKVLRELRGYLVQSGTKKLAVVHFKSVFGQEIVKTLSVVMDELKGAPVVDEAYQQIGGNDFKTTILKLRQEQVDTVFLDMVDVDPITFLKQAKELGYKPKIITYNAILDSFAGAKADTNLMEGVAVLDWQFSDPVFSTAYKAKYGVVPTKSADRSYAAIFVAAHAVVDASERSAIAARIAAAAFPTPIGEIKFNDKHAVDTIPVRIEVIKSGELVPLK